MKRTQLPQEIHYEGLGIGRVIKARRSERHFSGETMSIAELARLLLYSSGITDKRHGFRAAPSAGATYPLEVYAMINNVNELARGIYHYLIPSHELELVREGDSGQEMSQAALGEQMVRQANVVIALSAVSQRTERHYGGRAHRYILFEAGHIAQNAYLIATSMGMGACAIGAFYDDQLNHVLGLDGKNESVLYLIAVGKIK